MIFFNYEKKEYEQNKETIDKQKSVLHLDFF